MTPSQAILAGAAVIAASIIFVNTIRPAEAQRGGPYQLQHHSNIQANASVFRMDTSTGQLDYCYITPETRLVCVAEK